MTNEEILQELMQVAIHGVLDSSGVELTPSTAVQTSMEYAATIGFAASNMRGVVGIGMDGATLDKVSRQATGDAGVSPEDWLGETVNMLLGRLKNQMISYGVSASLALPTVLRGVRVHLISAGVRGVFTYTYDSDLGPFSIWMDVRWDDGFVMQRANNTDTLAEGELLLF